MSSPQLDALRSVAELRASLALEDAFSGPIQSSAPARWERKAAKTPSKTPSKQYEGDRFIPTRSAINKDLAHSLMNNAENHAPVASEGVSDGFHSKLAESLFDQEDGCKILAFNKKAPKPKEGHLNEMRALYTQNKANPIPKKKFRHIASAPSRILDAPDLVDDYYINVLDWGTNNLLAVGLGSSVYLWDAESGSIDLLCESKEEDNIITSVKWTADGKYLSIGNSYADVQLWDVTKKTQLRSMKGHMQRVGALAWNGHVLSSGSRDSMIFNHDVRMAQHHIATLAGHQQEICGLAWSHDGKQLASGGNDNLCLIWDADSTAPKFTLDCHTAAVKAVAWCPFQRNLLATGAGTADRHIRFFNTQTGACLQAVDTKSQVCSLQWSKTEKELVSAHGFSQNQLTVWKYPTMARIAELQGHSSRVLHTAISPDGTTVCSAAADETVRFWKVFESSSDKKAASAASGKTVSEGRLRMDIR